MQLIHIPLERLQIIKHDKGLLKLISEQCNCTVKIEDDALIIEGDAYAQMNARSVIVAFGSGFDINHALTLINDERYFSTIDLKQIFSSENRIKQVISRVVGVKGKAKRYMESVSGAKMSIHGTTISFIGSYDSIYEAETGVRAIIEGRNHRIAYLRMEAAHRKNKQRNRAAIIKI